MDCKEIRIRLAAYVDGELPQEGFLSLAAHVRACASCRRARAEQAFVLVEVRRAALRFVPPAGLRERLLGMLGLEGREE